MTSRTWYGTQCLTSNTLFSIYPFFIIDLFPSQPPQFQGLHPFHPQGPCGGFSTQYACYCDYYNLPYREEVAWDVDTIYFSHDSHELCLTDFEHLEQRDLICIISALEHNTWFTKLRASANTAKLAGDVVDKILAVVAKSPSLQELHLSSAGVRWEFFQRLAGAMGSNQYCNLNTLDISLNFVEDRGLISIANVLAHFPRGTRYFLRNKSKIMHWHLFSPFSGTSTWLTAPSLAKA